MYGYNVRIHKGPKMPVVPKKSQNLDQRSSFILGLSNTLVCLHTEYS